MGKTSILPNYYTAREIAAIMGESPELLQRLVKNGWHPLHCIRNKRWTEPRFPIETIRDWSEIIASIGPDGVPDPLPITRKSYEEPTAEDLAVARRILGLANRGAA